MLRRWRASKSAGLVSSLNLINLDSGGLFLICLMHPVGLSVNDGIDEKLSALSYMSVDNILSTLFFFWAKGQWWLKLMCRVPAESVVLACREVDRLSQDWPACSILF